jgi:hypothetical protein
VSEVVRDGRFVELSYTVTDRKSGQVLTRVEFRWATFTDGMKYWPLPSIVNSRGSPPATSSR